MTWNKMEMVVNIAPIHCQLPATELYLLAILNSKYNSDYLSVSIK